MGNLNFSQIPAPRVELMDSRTKGISRDWYRFFNELYTRVKLSSSMTAIFFDGLVEVLTDYSPTNDDKHLICSGTISITLQTPTERDSELIVTNIGTGRISFIGTVNGDTGKYIRYQYTSLRLRPTTTGYLIV